MYTKFKTQRAQSFFYFSVAHPGVENAVPWVGGLLNAIYGLAGLYTLPSIASLITPFQFSP
jgi:hypothetical protein